MISRILLLSELVLFLVGIFLPLLTVSEFWFFKNQISMIDIVVGLFVNQEFILGFAITLFGIAFPVAKILARLMGLKLFARMHLHKFSMLDIFLISFLVFASKFSSVFNASIDIGFYFLMCSILFGFFQILFKDKQFLNT